MKSKFSFLYVDFYFHVPECKFMLSKPSRIRQTNSQLYIFMSSPFRGLVTTKKSSKNIYKNKCREGEVETIQLSMLVYFQCFNIVRMSPFQ